MRFVRRCLAAAAGLALGTAAVAATPTFAVAQVFSSADGAIQFVELVETQGQDGQQALTGVELVVERDGRTRTFVFPTDLPRPQTAYRHVLVATEGYLTVPGRFPEFAAVAPDYVVPDRFLPADGGTLRFGDGAPFTYAALPRDGFSARYAPDGAIRDNSARNFGGSQASLPVVPVTAVEFHHAGLDHYFVSDLAPDIDALDSGRIGGWTRTGKAFAVWPISMGFLADVCRFYIPPEHGDSHFFSASSAECADVATKARTDPSYSGYVLETDQAFAMALPDAAGVCPNHWVPVYRLWNNRADSNHRYTADPAIKAAMLAQGYIAEGYGAEAVAMCSPL